MKCPCPDATADSKSLRGPAGRTPQPLRPQSPPVIGALPSRLLPSYVYPTLQPAREHQHQVTDRDVHGPLGCVADTRTPVPKGRSCPTGAHEGSWASYPQTWQRATPASSKASVEAKSTHRDTEDQAAGGSRLPLPCHCTSQDTRQGTPFHGLRLPHPVPRRQLNRKPTSSSRKASLSLSSPLRPSRKGPQVSPGPAPETRRLLASTGSLPCAAMKLCLAPRRPRAPGTCGPFLQEGAWSC